MSSEELVIKISSQRGAKKGKTEEALINPTHNLRDKTEIFKENDRTKANSLVT